MTTFTSRLHNVSAGLVALAVWLIALLCAFAATACSDSVLPREPGRIEITPDSAALVVGQFRQYHAALIGGAPTADTLVHWTSADERVASVSLTGEVTARSAGSVLLSAAVGRVQHTVMLTVEPWELESPSTLPVRSVTIVPANATLEVSSTALLSAVARDSAGSVLDSRPVAWSAAPDSIATVSDGLVTGLATGASVVLAACEGRTSVAPVNVGDDTPAPPVWPDLPSGYRALADEPFSDSLTAFWTLTRSDPANGHFIADSESPASPGGVLEVRYPAGFGGGAAPATAHFELGGVSNVFAGIWWKANAGWQGHPSNINKIAFLFPTQRNGDMYLALVGEPGGPFRLRVFPQFPGFERRNVLVDNVDSSAVTLGEWHRIEWLVEYNTPGARDGIVRWWLDGKLVGSHETVQFPPARLGTLQISPTWGGVGATKTNTDFFWFDHVFVARR